MPKETYTLVKKHKVKTFFSVMAAIVGVYFVLTSITAIWINRTLTSTTTYVDTVAPLVSKPAIQQYIAEKVTDAILNSSSVQTIATSLLPASESQVNLSTTQLNNLIQPVIQSNVLKIVRSSSFASTWRSTNQTAHTELINQLNGNSSEISLDLSPVINSVISELKTTQLSPIAAQVNITRNTGKLSVKGHNISKIRSYYKLYKASTFLVVVIAIIAIGLAILLSAHRNKMIRRILLWIGILALLQALVLVIPDHIKLSGQNMVTTDAVRALIGALFHGLIVTNIIVGVIGILAYIAMKLYSRPRHSVLGLFFNKG